MGYSHTGFQSIYRAQGTRQVTDSSGVGSTCSPSFSWLRNRG